MLPREKEIMDGRNPRRLKTLQLVYCVLFTLILLK